MFRQLKMKGVGVDNGTMSLKCYSRVCLLLVAAIVVADEVKVPAPLTAEEVDRAQDLCLQQLEKQFVAVSAKTSAEALNGLWHDINRARISDNSPFAPGFQYRRVEVSATVEKSARAKSSVERQTQQDVDEIFARALKLVAEAWEAYDAHRTRAVNLRLTKASKEIAKIKVILEVRRKRRGSSPEEEARVEKSTPVMEKGILPETE